MASKSPFVLVVGVPTGHSLLKNAPGGEAALEKVREQIRNAQDYAKENKCGMYILGLGPEEGMSPFEKALQQYKPTSVMIGGGLKMLPECHEELEQLINTVTRYSIDNAFTPLVIVPNPTVILETAKRAVSLAISDSNEQ